MPELGATLVDRAWVFDELHGIDRATTDETHRIALVHPLYDGFLSLLVTARTDIDVLRIRPDDALDPYVTVHHVTGALRRGQTRPIDIELHPGTVPTRGVSGTISVMDASGSAACAPVRLTLATHPSLECVLAGAVDGPFAPADIERLVAELHDGKGTARSLAHRIEQVAAGRTDPGWSRWPWGRT